MRRRIRPITAWVMLFALLFAQFATAAYACPQLVERAVVAHAPDCHDTNTSPNLCERHCDYGKASFEKPKPFTAPDLAVFFVRPPAVVAVAIAGAPRSAAHAGISTGPPHTRFTVLRI